MNAAVNRSERRAFVAALRSSRTFFIVGLVLVALLPMAAALITLRSGSGLGAARIAARLCGVLGLSLLTLSLVPFADLPCVARRFNPREAALLDRTVGLLGSILAAAHLILKFRQLPEVVRVLPADRGGLLPTPTFVAMAAALAVLAVLWLTADPWRGGIHSALRIGRFWLTAAIVAFAFAQAYFAEAAARSPLVFYLWDALLLAAAIGAAVGGVVLPLRSARYEVSEIAEIGADAVETTFVRRTGHAGVLPGQSVGLALNGGAFSGKPLFYVSGVGKDGTLCAAFPGGRDSLRVGTKAAVGIAHGNFRLDRLGADGFVFIVDGYGIAAAIASLRTLAERRDPRRLTLVYRADSETAVWFAGELARLEERLKLTVVRLIGEPISAESIRRVYPRERDRYDVFVCGSKPLRKAARDAFKMLKVPAANQWFEA